jgi:hypothetical protein
VAGGGGSSGNIFAVRIDGTPPSLAEAKLAETGFPATDDSLSSDGFTELLEAERRYELPATKPAKSKITPRRMTTLVTRSFIIRAMISKGVALEMGGKFLGFMEAPVCRNGLATRAEMKWTMKV